VNRICAVIVKIQRRDVSGGAASGGATGFSVQRIGVI
jgi:hypothetical protein